MQSYKKIRKTKGITKESVAYDSAKTSDSPMEFLRIGNYGEDSADESCRFLQPV